MKSIIEMKGTRFELAVIGSYAYGVIMGIDQYMRILLGVGPRFEETACI